jgi:hypothetical protein
VIVGDPASVVGPERLALESARRWSVLVLAIVGLGLETVAVLTVWSDLPNLQRAVIGAAIVTAIVAAIFRRTTTSLWVFAFAGLMLVLANLLPPAGVPWLHLNADVLFVAFTFALLVRPVYAVFLALTLPVLTHIAWETNPGDVIATGYAAWGGWIPPIQVAVMMLVVNTVWWQLSRYASTLDGEYQREQEQLERSLAEQERQASRRRAAIVIHESLLNGIRAVLTAGLTDPQRLISSMPPDASLEAPLPVATDANALGTSILETAGVPIQMKRQGSSTRNLEPETFESVRGAVVEIARNEYRHGEGRSVDLLVSASDAALTVTIAGQLIVAEPLESGLGVRTAVLEALEAANVEVAQADGAVIITVRRDLSSTPRTAPSSVFSRSRALMTAFLGSMALSGVLYFIALTTAEGMSLPTVLAMLLATIAAIVLILVTVTGTRLRASTGLPLTFAPAMIPWLMVAGASGICASAPEIAASAVNVTGFAVIGLSLWTRWWVMIPALGIWLAGMGLFVATAPSGCGSLFLVPAANSVIVMLLFVGGTLAAARVYSLAESQRNELEYSARAERIAADAQAQTNARLASLVAGVRAEFSRIHEGAPVDEATEHRLRLYEGRIRTAVQVDPLLSGSFQKVAAELVESMATQDIAVDVKLLEASDDQRALPNDVEELLTRFAEGGQTTLAAFTDGRADYLTVAAPRENVPWLDEMSDLTVDDVEVLIDDSATASSERGGRIVMVRRPLPA